MNYTDGYISGQHDALTWLSESPMPGDSPLCFIDRMVTTRAALFCLAHNLRWAGALCAAFELGEYFERDTAIGGWRLDRRWAPGCRIAHDCDPGDETEVGQ